MAEPTGGAYVSDAARQAAWAAGVRDAAFVLAQKGLVGDPVLTVLDELQRTGSVCSRCNGLVERHDPTGDGLSEFWSHVTHPSDGHDAVPVQHPAAGCDDLGPCEGCGAPAVGVDDDDVPLCSACFVGLNDEEATLTLMPPKSEGKFWTHWEWRRNKRGDHPETETDRG